MPHVLIGRAGTLIRAGVVIALMLGFVLYGVRAQAQEADKGTLPQIAVTGHGEVSAVPDRAILTFGIVTTGETAEPAVAENADATSSVRKALEDAGIAPAEIGTGRYSVDARQSYPNSSNGENLPPRITGYVVTHELTLSTTDLDALGALIDTAIAAGANSVSSIAFDFTDRATLEREAAALAVGDALAKARHLAEAAGLQFGGVLTISEPSASAALPEAVAYRAAANAATYIQPGETTVSAEIVVTARLLP